MRTRVPEKKIPGCPPLCAKSRENLGEAYYLEELHGVSRGIISRGNLSRKFSKEEFWQKMQTASFQLGGQFIIGAWGKRGYFTRDLRILELKC